MEKREWGRGVEEGIKKLTLKPSQYHLKYQDIKFKGIFFDLFRHLFVEEINKWTWGIPTETAFSLASCLKSFLPLQSIPHASHSTIFQKYHSSNNFPLTFQENQSNHCLYNNSSAWPPKSRDYISSPIPFHSLPHSLWAHSSNPPCALSNIPGPSISQCLYSFTPTHSSLCEPEKPTQHSGCYHAWLSS